MKVKKAGIAALLVYLLAGQALAQEFRGRVQGVVSDPGGGVVPGATVALKNDHTGVGINRESNSEGRYFFDYVDPGTYTLTIELAGFKTAVQKNIIVAQRGDVTVDMKLEIGSLSETVTVSESPVAVQFNTASRDLTLDKQMVVDLPSATRNPWQLALLDPTVAIRWRCAKSRIQRRDSGVKCNGCMA